MSLVTPQWKRAGALVSGALLSLASFVVWALGDVFTKLAGTSGLPIFLIVGIASWANALFFLAAYAAPEKRRRIWPCSWRRHAHLLLIELIATPLSVLSFTRLPLTTVYAALFLSPLLISLYAALFMREPLGRKQLQAILLGFVGVMIALKPSGTVLSRETLEGYAALAGFVLLFVWCMILYRRYQDLETPENMAFAPIFFRAIVFLPLYIGVLDVASWRQIVYTAISGVTMGVGTLLMARAYQKAPAAVVSPFHYSQIIVGGIAGYLLWGDRPSGFLVGGALLVIASGLLIAHDAHQKDQGKICDHEPLEEKVPL